MKNLKQLHTILIDLSQNNIKFNCYCNQINKTNLKSEEDFEIIDFIAKYISYLINIKLDLEEAKSFMENVIMTSNKIEYKYFENIFESIRIMPINKKIFISIYKNGEFWVNAEPDDIYWHGMCE